MHRGEIFARDNYRCVFCGQIFPEEELTVDHLQARSRGGDRSGGNLVTACGACNLKKGRTRLAHYLAQNPSNRARPDTRLRRNVQQESARARSRSE